MLSWRNWHTRRIQVPVPSGVWVRLPPRARTLVWRNGRRTRLRAGWAHARGGSTPLISTAGRGPGSKTSLQEDSAGFDSLSLHVADEEHVDVRSLAMAEEASSRPAIRSKLA